MREREVQEHHVTGLGEALFHLIALLHHRVVVAVSDHAGLRRPRCSRRVDEGEEVVLVDRVGALLQLAGMLGGIRASALAQGVELVEADHVLDTRHLGALLVVFDKDADGLRMVEDVLHIPR